MSYETILFDVDAGVATVTLNRPERLNAFTPAMLNELLDVMDRVDADDAVRAVVFTGSGRGFCAGADLGSGASAFDPGGQPRSDDRYPDRDGGGVLTLRLFESTKPLIAAINGPAVGVGATMTLPMDIRMASTGAKLGFVFTRRAIVMEAASSWFLPRVVGIGQAMEWVLSGRVFPAAEALAGGLVRSLHEPEALLPAAYDVAREIAENTAPVSVALCRQMLWKMLGEPHPMAAHRIDTAGVRACRRLPDAREGVDSFLEKRAPRFSGRPSEDLPDFYPWWETPPFSPVE